MAREYKKENSGRMEEQELRKDFDEWGNPLPERDTTGYMEFADHRMEEPRWEDMGR